MIQTRRTHQSLWSNLVPKVKCTDSNTLDPRLSTIIISVTNDEGNNYPKKPPRSRPRSRTRQRTYLTVENDITASSGCYGKECMHVQYDILTSIDGESETYASLRPNCIQSGEVVSTVSEVTNKQIPCLIASQLSITGRASYHENISVSRGDGVDGHKMQSRNFLRQFVSKQSNGPAWL